MTGLRCPTVVLLLSLAVGEILSSEPVVFTINTKKWSHVLDDHFISVTVNPTDLLQGKAFGLGMNSTIAILKGLSPAYIRIGSADSGKYTFKRSRYSSDVARAEDEFIITESHWTILNDAVRSAGLDLIVCLNAAHRNAGSRKWDTRNSLELISFSDSKGYNLTFQLGYEVQRSSGISGHQYGKDLNRLRTILNAFPRYQHSKLIGPDIRYLQRKEDVEFVNDVLAEAGSTLDAVTWHPRWPQPSKMKVSDVSELGYEFPSDYIEWDRTQLGKILQRSIFKNPIWIGEPKTESTGTFAEGLLWARRLILAAKLGVEVVMKQPSLMDISHPKPEYWIAFLHKRLLGKAVLETRAANNQSEIGVITHCTNPQFWSERSNKALDGSITVYGINMGGKEQKVYMKGPWGGKSQIILQYLLTSGSDPDSIFSQMTYLNGEPLMMTDDGHLPDITPRARRMDRGVLFKLPPYSVGFWVVPEARVKVCQAQPVPATPPHFDNLSAGMRHGQKNFPNIRNLNQLIVDKLKNPVSESDEELYDDRILSDDSSERDGIRESLESPAPRTSRRVRQITVEDIGQELKDKIREIREMLEEKSVHFGKSGYPSETLRTAEEKISSLTKELGAATRLTDQQEEFGRFLHQSGLNDNFGMLMVNDRMGNSDGFRRSVSSKWNPLVRAPTTFDPFEAKVRRFRRSLSSPQDDYEEESVESNSFEEEDVAENGPGWKTNYRKRILRSNEDSDEGGNHPNYQGSPVLKSLDDKYKTLLSYRIQDGKRKFSDIRRTKKKDETEEAKKSAVKRPNTLANDLQEEILVKEVEVLQKTEEAMANLIKNHKKRQQTIEEIILHEISDIKEDRISALEDIREQNALKQGYLEDYTEVEELPNKIPRSVIDVLHNSKTKRSISEGDSILNGLPEEEKKLKITKRSVDSTYERRRKSRKTNRGDETSSERESRRRRKSRSERLERMKNFIQSRERIRDRNRRKHHKNLRKYKLGVSDEESNEVLSDYGNDFLDKSEDLVIKEIQKELMKKPERSEMKITVQDRVKTGEEKMKTPKNEEKNERTSNNDNNKITSNNVSSNNNNNSGQNNNDNQNVRSKTEMEEKTNQESPTTSKTVVKKVKEQAEYVPLKIDKNRGLHVLKRISNLVESINSRERSKARKPSMDVEDLSDEFYGDSISKISKRRHRRSHHRDGEPDNSVDEREEEDSEEIPPRDLKTLRKEIKLRKILERRNRKKKLTEEEEAGEGGKGSRRRLKSKLHAKGLRRMTTEPPAEELAQSRDIEIETEKLVEATLPPPEKVIRDESSQKITTEMESEQPIPEIPPEEKETEAEVGEVAAEAPKELNMAEEMTEMKEVETEVEQVVTEESPNEKEIVEKSFEEKTEKPLEEVKQASEEPEDGEKVEEAPPVEDNESAKGEPAEEKVEAMTEEIPEATPTTPMPVTEAPPQPAELPKQTSVEEPADSSNSAYVIPEIGELLFDRVVLANSPDNMDFEREVSSEGEESLLTDDGVLIVSPYVRAENPRDMYDESGEEEGGIPDLITELMEGDKIKPWKGAILDEVPGSQEDKVNKKRSFTPGLEIEDLPRRFALDDSAGYPHHKIADSFQSNGDIGDPSIIQTVPTETIYTSIPTEKYRTLRRSRRGIFDRRPPSAEERIRNFKRMVHRRHSPFTQKNELPISAEGDNFWKVAGSTVKAVFNDVIPEAYGKTKDKIENLGIAEYFKQFGKIVEQMKNLDRLFANIGQAAVRNYIKGTEDDKGGYIQVIEKRRSRRDVNNSEDSEPTTVETAIQDNEVKVAEPETTTTTTTTTIPPTTNIRPKGLRNYVKKRPNDLIRDIFLMDSNPGIVEVTKSPPTTAPVPTISLQPFESRYANVPNLNFHNRFFRSSKTPKEMQPLEMNKFAPWMKTTKEFINQALTTLQRQRELSEMIARESVNDLVKREIERKVIRKREIPEDKALFPVYQMPNTRKREVYTDQDEGISRYLTHLQPGVYIVPTEEMKNLRSEQIMKEAPPTKPGVPNMVTLNIYYDKKKPQEWEAPKEDIAEPKSETDYLRYYQTPSYTWNPVPVATPPDYISHSNMENRYLTEGLPTYQTEMKIHESLNPRIPSYPEAYPEWIPRGYPVIPRTHPTYFYPAETHFHQPKTEWELKQEVSSLPPGDSGWAVQFHPTKKKTRSRELLRPIERQQRLLPDKKRSIGSKSDLDFPGLALPFYKMLKSKSERATVSPPKKEKVSSESESLEDLFAENRKRAKQNEAKAMEGKSKEDKEAEAEEEEEEEITPKDNRRKREVADAVQDLLPEWFGTIQDLDNTLHEVQEKVERSTASDYDDQLLLDFNRRKRSADSEKPPEAPVLKKLDSEDSSLEVPGGGKSGTGSSNHTQQENPKTGSSEDALTHFFKYAYDSLIQMMKGMTGFI